MAKQGQGQGQGQAREREREREREGEHGTEHGLEHRRGQHVRVAVVGSGFGGLGAAVRLRRAGVTDFVVLERADSVGGTWRDNSYPGCACDVPSHLYSFSFAPNPDWPRTFSGQEHIRAYLEQVTDVFRLRPHIRFNAEVQRMTWDGERLCWDIETSGGQLSADVVVSATGPLSDPRIPDVPGIDTFPGKVFHSARWGHDYDLRGKRVAMVGTGASAIQIVPEIQPRVGRLTLFQRTPPWVMPRVDRAVSDVERWLHRQLPFTTRLRRGFLWGVRELQVQAFTRHPNELGLIERMARRNMARAVKDPALRAKLTPDYRIGCKRILLSNTYYPALTRPNVDVVASGLAEIDGSTLIAADGTRAEADAIVFGTGFHVTDMPIAERVVGADGRTLAEAWSQSGMRSLRGASAAGFPNWLTVIGPNTGLGNSSMILIIESQLNYMVDFVRQLDGLGGRVALDARPSAVTAWNLRVQERMKRTVWNTGGCTSWYLDASGRNTTIWPGTTTEFRGATRRVNLGEYEVLRAPNPSAAPRPGHGEVPHDDSGGRSVTRLMHVRSGPYAPSVPVREVTAVSADGARLHVEAHGPEDGPAVVLAHGWTCSTAFWAAQIRDLAADHRVIVYDQRGHGRSPVGTMWSTDVLADDLEAVLRAMLAPGERAVVVGHSMGGMTVMAASARRAFREHVAAALLLSTGSSNLVAESLVVPIRAGRLRTWVTRKILGSRLPLGPVTPVAMAILKYGTMGAGSSPLMVEACARIVHACPRRVRYAWARVLDRLDLDHGVRELRVPTAVVVGLADRLTPPVQSRAMAAALPECVGLTELLGVGHMTPVEAPELVCSRIRELVSAYLTSTGSTSTSASASASASAGAGADEEASA